MMDFFESLYGMSIFEFFFGQGSFDAMLYIAVIIVVVAVVMGHVAYATYFERKTIGHMQVRLGPMRVGWHGLLQPIADFVKLFFKEDIIPENADKPVFYIAPVIAVFATLTSLAVLPFVEGFVVADINVGLLFVFAMSSLGAYGLIMAGWSSNSKYSFLGGLRSSAQVISYEISMGLSLVGVMIMAGSLNLTDIVRAQQAYPLKVFAIPQIIGFVVFFIAMLAETNRTPFDLPEAESELVAGYFVEYSGFRFALFFAAEYIGMIIMSTIGAICFLGGWNGPFDLPIPGFPVVWLALKIYFFMFMYYWVRATVPRYRYDQLMNLGWKLLLPLALFNIVLTGTIKILV
jgi:NADH-quinone oxidoreductase subunit H